MHYGSKIVARDLIELLQIQLDNKGLPPLCIWGSHGIGKTEIVRDFARERNIHFRYIAPAQFEEMGDLTGMPAIVDGQTVLRPPAWVPAENGPGILLLDDLNRADERILRGLMPLFQGYGMLSWKLPYPWRIICTANPDDGSYSVNRMDPALMTRLMHVQLEFSLHNWASWARSWEIAEKHIQFVQLHSTELFQHEQCTPRSLSHFFHTMEAIPEGKKTKALILNLAESMMDPNASKLYMAFLDKWQAEWVHPEDFLRGGQTEMEALRKLLQKGPKWQMAFGNALLAVLEYPESRWTKTDRNNLLNFLQAPELSAAFRLQFIRNLASIEKSSIRAFLAEPEVLELLDS